jgi:sigma-B regulation protein RsbU (phosphoserine phosphatase)
MYYFSFLYIQSKHESILKEKYNIIKERVLSIDEAASNYKNSLLHLAINIKNLEETKKFKLVKLRVILNEYKEKQDLNDFYVFNKTGEILLKNGKGKGDDFSNKLSSALARSVMDFYNGKKFKTKGNLKSGDSLQAVLSNLLFDPKKGTLKAIFKDWGKIHTFDFLGKKYNFYINVIVDDKENSNGVIVLYFRLLDKLQSILKSSIITNNNSLIKVKLFSSPLENISIVNQFPEPFTPDLTNFAHKIVMENASQKGIINYKGVKMLLLGTKLKEVEKTIVMGILPYSEVSILYEQTINLLIRLFIISILVILSISILISRKFLLPIKIIQEGVEAIGKQNLDYKLNIDSNDEFGNLSKTFNNMTTSLKDTMFQLELSNENLKLTNVTLDKRLSELQVLYDISHKLHYISEIDDLIELILVKINETLKSHHSSVLLLNKERDSLELKMIKGVEIPEGVLVQLKPDEGIAGLALKENRVILVNDVNNDERFKPLNTKEEEHSIKSLLCAPLVISNVPIGVINVVDKMTEDRMFSTEDSNLLNSIASQLSITIENFYLQKEIVEKERMEKELEIAKEIQAGLFPDEIPVIANYSIDFNNNPAKECGGDYYDYINLTDELTAFTIADVSGKGVPAALIMVMAKSVLMVEAPKDFNTQNVVQELNNQLSKTITQGRFITFFYGTLEHKTGVFKFTNGGHNYPYMYRAKTGEIEELELDGMILGVMEDMDYETKEVTFETGDVLVLYTDGVTEALNNEGVLFSDELLQETILELHDLSATEIRKEIEKKVFEHANGAPQSDDITIIVIKKEE